MKYENAGEVLPEELLKEIQKYAAGKLLIYRRVRRKKAGEKRPATGIACRGEM